MQQMKLPRPYWASFNSGFTPKVHFYCKIVVTKSSFPVIDGENVYVTLYESALSTPVFRCGTIGYPSCEHLTLDSNWCRFNSNYRDNILPGWERAFRFLRTNETLRGQPSLCLTNGCLSWRRVRFESTIRTGLWSAPLPLRMTGKAEGNASERMFGNSMAPGAILGRLIFADSR